MRVVVSDLLRINSGMTFHGLPNFRPQKREERADE